MLRLFVLTCHPDDINKLDVSRKQINLFNTISRSLEINLNKKIETTYSKHKWFYELSRCFK